MCISSTDLYFLWGIKKALILPGSFLNLAVLGEQGFVFLKNIMCIKDKANLKPQIKVGFVFFFILDIRSHDNKRSGCRRNKGHFTIFA